MLARVCDRCGRKINPTESVLHLYVGEVDHMTGEISGKIKQIINDDYCEECASVIIAGIREGKTEAKVQKTKKQAGKESAS